MAKHNKIKNVGVLFELLTRQITSDTINGVEKSPAIDIVKEHFSKNSYLTKELNLFKALQNQKYKTETQADRFVEVVVKEHAKLSKSKLNNARYSIIRDIKSNYNIEDFFKSRVSNYKLNASIYNLLEGSKKVNKPALAMKSRTTIVEHITSSAPVKSSEQKIIKEFSTLDKDIRILAYKILLEKFNSKYGKLSTEQRSLLKEYINNISNSSKLKQYMTEEINLIKKSILKCEKKVTDSIVKIKLAEVRTQLTNVIDDTVIRDKHLVSILRAYDLVKELNNVTK